MPQKNINRWRKFYFGVIHSQLCTEFFLVHEVGTILADIHADNLINDKNCRVYPLC